METRPQSAQPKFCTKESPRPPDGVGHWIHMDAVETRTMQDRQGNKVIRMQCPNCNIGWWKEVKA